MLVAWLTAVLLGWQGNTSHRGPQEVYSPNLCSQQAQLWLQTRSLRDLSSWMLKISRCGDWTPSLGNLSCCLAVLLGKIYVLMSHLTPSCSSCVLSSCPTPLRKAGVCHLSNLLVGVCRLLWEPLKAFFYWGWTNPAPLIFLYMVDSSPGHLGVPWLTLL